MVLLGTAFCISGTICGTGSFVERGKLVCTSSAPSFIHMYRLKGLKRFVFSSFLLRVHQVCPLKQMSLEDLKRFKVFQTIRDPGFSTKSVSQHIILCDL